MKIAIVTGEASGDVLGADLMRNLDADFEGIGGHHMKREGLNSLFAMEELSVMGIVEVLPRAPALLKRVRETAEFVINGDFDALITVDSPDFSHRVASRVKKIQPNMPIIHYVAPSVWAWRPKRAKKMARHVDHVLCLLPFEPPYMQAAGMSADFVGHPAARMEAPKSLKTWKKANPNVLGLFPGSRRSEIANHLSVYREFLEQLDEARPVMVPTSDFLFDEVSQSLKHLENVDIFSPTHCDDDFDEQKQCLLYGAEMAVATSGTVSFELSWADTNCIVGYQTNGLNRFLAKQLIKVPYASLTNILLGEEAIPEFIFGAFTAENILSQYNAFMSDAEMREAQRDDYTRMRHMMIPDFDAASAVKRFLETR